MKYRYDEKECAFVRLDNKGRRLKLDKDTATEICYLVNEGFSIKYIFETVPMNVKYNSLKTFIARYRNNEIVGFNPSDFNLSKWDRFKRFIKGGL